MSYLSNHSNLVIKKTFNMKVIKRNGKHEEVDPNKIITRMKEITKKMGLTRVDPIAVALETIQGLKDFITTEELDFFAANKCAEKILEEPQYDALAAGICISNLHKTTPFDFLEVTKKLYNNKYEKKHSPLVTDKYRKFVNKNIDKIRKALGNYERDYLIDFFGIKTLERSYLNRIKSRNDDDLNIKGDGNEIKKIKTDGRIIERPQHMFMRVSLGIHLDNIDDALETYDLMSQKYFTHASPTLFNAGTPRPQLSSCFLLNMGDSLEEIFDTVKDAAFISKLAGGIGINLSNIRAKGSHIRGTNGISDGIIPLIKMLNEEARYVNQGGRRKGAFAVYIEPWHADIYQFCELRKTIGVEELRARDIFLAMWTNDLFMERVLSEGDWALMCPDECPGLTTTYGDEFNKLYIKYENDGNYKKVVKAAELYNHILSCQQETGMPYMLFKDNINRQSNQKNIGVIQCSNLCSEIVEYTAPDEIAVCNLASVCLPKFIDTTKKGKLIYNYDKLYQVVKVITKNLNKIIDINHYPVKKAKKSNSKHRPIGIGVQGLSDVYCILGYPFDSVEARDINKKIFETIYFSSLEASMELAKRDGPYETFKGSPFSEGKLQWHLWGLEQKDLLMPWDWSKLIIDIKEHGVRNSLLTAVMPTASTSQIMGNTVACEPIAANMFNRATLAGEYVVIRKHLIEKLISMNLWTKEIKEEFLYDKGSIQKIDEIPDEIKKIYLTAFEMSNKPLLVQAIERGPFIDQSQSQNMFCDKPDTDMLFKSHIYAWKNKLKTGMYYLRSQAAVDALNFGLDYEAEQRIRAKRNIVQIETTITIKEKDVLITESSNSLDISIPPVNPRSKFADCESCSG